MLYFTELNIDPLLLSEDTENAIRNFSSKRYTSLDMHSSSFYQKEDKYFLGHEGKDDVKIMRIRTPFEKLLPKLIVSFPKNKQFKVYKIRYSLLSTFVFCILSMAILQSIYSLVVNQYLEREFVPLIIVFAIFIGLTYLEINLVRIKIDRALKNYAYTKVNTGC